MSIFSIMPMFFELKQSQLNSKAFYRLKGFALKFYKFSFQILILCNQIKINISRVQNSYALETFHANVDVEIVVAKREDEKQGFPGN
jgi:hypothetical protein